MKRFNKSLAVILAFSLCASQGIAGFKPGELPAKTRWLAGFGVNAKRLFIKCEKTMLNFAELTAQQAKKRKLGKKGFVGAAIFGVSTAALVGICAYKKTRGYKINRDIEDAKPNSNDFSGQVEDQPETSQAATSCFSFLKNKTFWAVAGVTAAVTAGVYGYKAWNKKKSGNEKTLNARKKYFSGIGFELVSEKSDSNGEQMFCKYQEVL